MRSEISREAPGCAFCMGGDLKSGERCQKCGDTLPSSATPSRETLIEHATLLESGMLLAKSEIVWRAKVLAKAFLASVASETGNFCANPTGCETPNDCREHHCCRSPKALRSASASEIPQNAEAIKIAARLEKRIRSDTTIEPLSNHEQLDHDAAQMIRKLAASSATRQNQESYERLVGFVRQVARENKFADRAAARLVLQAAGEPE